MVTIKCLIAPPCNDVNRGDQALVWESVCFVAEIMDRRHPNSVIDSRVIAKGDDIEEERALTRQTVGKGYRVLPNLLTHPRRKVRRKSRQMHDTGATLMRMIGTAVGDFLRFTAVWALPGLYRILLRDNRKRKTFEFLRTADYLAIKGGGFLHAYGNWKDIYYIWFQTFYILFAHRLRVPVIVLPNSVGPIKGCLVRTYLKLLLGRCTVVYARESISLEYLETALSLSNVRYMPDLAYFLELPRKPETELPAVASAVGITVRPYRFPGAMDPKDKYLRYINAIAEFCRDLSSLGYIPHLVVHVKGPGAHEDDRIAIAHIMEVMDRKPSVIDISGDCIEMAKMYGRFDYVVGTRFHSVIFSQIMNVPAIAIAYGGNKSRGIMRDLGLEDFVIDIASIEGNLLSKFTNLVSNRRSYCEQLENSRTRFERIRKEELTLLGKA